MDGLIMKRMNNLYENILDYDRCLKMYKTIKTNCKNKKEVYKYFLNLNQSLLDVLDRLKNETYVFDKYRIFLITEPKYRLIMSEKVEDKIVNHLISKYILLPALEKSLVDSNVATRYEKGSGYAFDLILKYINRLRYFKKEIYVLKIDISKYFYNIDHEICMREVEKKIKDKKVLKILSEVLDTTNQMYVNREIKYLKNKEINRVKHLNISDKEKQLKIEEISKIPLYYKGKGLPIGNMTSQILAVYYLNEVDHYIKEELKFKNYIRYMDDLIILDVDKEKLKDSYEKIKSKLLEFKLETNKKSNIYKLSNGFSFLGYKFQLKYNKLLIRYNVNTSRRIARRLKNLKKYDYSMYLKSRGSYKGYLERCNTSLYNKIMDI